VYRVYRFQYSVALVALLVGTGDAAANSVESSSVGIKWDCHWGGSAGMCFLSLFHSWEKFARKQLSRLDDLSLVNVRGRYNGRSKGFWDVKDLP
jgi:hypothetical protein